MSDLTVDWAIVELDKFIQQTVMRNASSSGNGWVSILDKNLTAAPDVEMAQQASTVEQILDRVLPRRHTEVPKTSANNRWAQHRGASLRACKALIRDRDARENLGDDAPKISASQLHPWTWSGGSSLWSSSHYRKAIGTAARKLNAETQNKVDRRDVSETDLFKQVFLTGEAKPGKARLRCTKPDEGDTYESVQHGAMAFTEGVYARIRHPLRHGASIDLDEQTAPEYLAALGVPARWVDDAGVERTEEAS